MFGFVQIAQADIRHAVDSETSGSYRKGLKAVAQSVMNRPKYFAERLMKSMKGLGTDETTLIRIVASRAEVNVVTFLYGFFFNDNGLKVFNNNER